MSDELPSAWGQICPRSVRLAPDGLLVPAATLRVLLRDGRSEDLIYTGYGLEPSVRDGETVRVSGARPPRRGDLILCAIDGWGDLLRALRSSPDGSWSVAVDALPARRAAVSADRILGVAEERRRAGFAALRFAWRRVQQAPDFLDGPSADASVLEKYRQQVAGYQALQKSTLSEDLVRLLARRLPAAGTILVGGSGAGSEAIQLARLGYRITGFDALPEMIRASQQAADAAGTSVEFVLHDLATLDLAGRRFDGIYLTPLLYSFLALRERRIAALRRLARHLTEGGCVLLSAQPYRGPAERLQTALAVILRRLRGSPTVEAGDWYTWFLTPQGRIGYSYLHRFTAGALEAELQAGGFRLQNRLGAHVLAVRR